MKTLPMRVVDSFLKSKLLNAILLGITLIVSNVNAQTSQITELNKLAKANRQSQPDKTIAICWQVQCLLKNDSLNPEFALSLRNMGMAFYYQFEYEKAEKTLTRCLNIAILSGNYQEQSASHVNLGLVLRATGNMKAAKEHFLSSVEIDRKSGDKEGMTFGLNNLADVYMMEGNSVKAKEIYLQTLEIEYDEGNTAGIGDALNNLGTVHYENGEYRSSLNYYNKALECYKKVESQVDIAMVLNNIGAALILLHQFEEAEEYLNQSIHIREDIGDIMGLANCYLKMGELYNIKDDQELAEEWFFKGMNIALEVGNYKQLANGFNQRGLNLLEHGDSAGAVQYLQNSLEFAEQLNYSRLMIQVLDTLIMLTSARNDYKSAFNYMKMRENITSEGIAEHVAEKNTQKAVPKVLSSEKKSSAMNTLLLFLIAIILIMFAYILALRSRLRKIKQRKRYKVRDER